MRISGRGWAMAAAAGFLGIGLQAAHADEASVPEQIVNAMNKIWGSHAGFRANHAKGIVLEGNFVPAPAAATISKASIFKGSAVPVTVRFSDATGVPNLPDGNAYANPHGMALKFHVADGGELDLVTNSLPFFPVATGEEFLGLFTALLASGPESPKPTKIEQFVAAHPTVATATAGIATPTSLAREVYNGVDAFVFVDAAGKRQPFRWRLVPAAGAEHLAADEAGKQAPDFLMAELPTRLAKAPVVFRLTAQLADPSDQTKDPTKPWPDSRKTVDLGTITLIKAVADSAAAEKALLYLPTNLIDGIEASDDPLIDIRSQAYAVSFSRRQQ